MNYTDSDGLSADSAYAGPVKSRLETSTDESNACPIDQLGVGGQAANAPPVFSCSTASLAHVISTE